MALNDNTLIKYIVPATRVTIVLAVFTGLFFPIFIYLLAHLFFSHQAAGCLLYDRNGMLIGSTLIGQNFSQPKYFHSRPSAAGLGYDAAASAGSNLGPTSKKLIEGLSDNLETKSIDESFDGIKQLAEKYRQENNLAAQSKVPIDAVTRSASGLDPHISVQNAIIQAPRIASSRHLSLLTVLNIIEVNKTPRQFGFLGEPCVNVLKANLALDKNLSN